MIQIFSAGSRFEQNDVTLKPSISRSFIVVTITGFMMIVNGRFAHAQMPGDRETGRQVAIANCSSCHQIFRRRTESNGDAVPSFQAIAAMPSTTELSINVFLRTSHDVMPNLQLSENHIADLATYIPSLRDPTPTPN